MHETQPSNQIAGTMADQAASFKISAGCVRKDTNMRTGSLLLPPASEQLN